MLSGSTYLLIKLPCAGNVPQVIKIKTSRKIPPEASHRTVDDIYMGAGFAPWARACSRLFCYAHLHWSPGFRIRETIPTATRSANSAGALSTPALKALVRSKNVGCTFSSMGENTGSTAYIDLCKCFVFCSPIISSMIGIQESNGEPSEEARLIYLGACLIAGIRLARESQVARTIPVETAIKESLWLARQILNEERVRFADLFGV